MLDIGWSELLLIAVVALVVIGPKDLPRVLFKAGQMMGRAKGMARHVRSGFDAMVREAELDEMQKAWAKQNAAIMAAHPATGESCDPPLPTPRGEPRGDPGFKGEAASRSDDGGVTPPPPGTTSVADADGSTPLRHQPAADATPSTGGGS